MAMAAGLRDVKALTGWRREVFGEDALRLCDGEIGLAVKVEVAKSRPRDKCGHGRMAIEDQDSERREVNQDDDRGPDSETAQRDDHGKQEKHRHAPPQLEEHRPQVAIVVEILWNKEHGYTLPQGIEKAEARALRNFRIRETREPVGAFNRTNPFRDPDAAHLDHEQAGQNRQRRRQPEPWKPFGDGHDQLVPSEVVVEAD